MAGESLARLGKQFAVVAVSVATSTLLTFLIEPFDHNQSPLLPFTLAIIVSAWYGGIISALSATALSFLISDYFFIEPIHQVLPLTYSHLILLSVFLAVGVSISMLHTALARSNTALSAAVRNLEEAAERSELASQHANIGFHEFRADTNMQIWSPEMEQLFGLAPGTFEGSYADWVKRMHPEDRDRVVRGRQECIDTRAPEWRYAYRAVLAHGRVRWLEGRSRLFYSTTGALDRILGATIEVTERQELQQRLMNSNEELERFAYAVSHDLKEPLRAVTTMTELFFQRNRGNLDQDSMRLLDFVLDAATRMRRMIEDMLELARVDSDLADLDSDADMDRALRLAIQDLQPAILESKAKVTNDPLPRLRGSEGQLVRVFRNLISNAIKYRSDRSPEIHISASPEGGGWVFCVSDNGIGIDAKYLAEIFDPFKRLHGSSRQYQGTGLGLTLVRKILQRHQGRIWVQSEVANGSRFYFALPARNSGLELLKVLPSPTKDSSEKSVGAA